MTITMTHFGAAVVFAFFASIVFGITQRTNPRAMVLYRAYCFGLFTLGTIAAGWVMWLLKR